MKENLAVNKIYSHNMIDKQIICTEFAPDVFAHLRELDGFKNDDLKLSMDPNITEND